MDNVELEYQPEALEYGTVHLVGTNYEKIVGEVSTLLDDAEAYRKMSQAVNPYGDGLACERISAFLANVWCIVYDVWCVMYDV